MWRFLIKYQKRDYRRGLIVLHSRACSIKKAPPINQRSLSYIHPVRRDNNELLRLTYLPHNVGWN